VGSLFGYGANQLGHIHRLGSTTSPMMILWANSHHPHASIVISYTASAAPSGAGDHPQPSHWCARGVAGLSNHGGAQADRTSPRRSNGEHRARRQADHLLGDASQDQMSETGASMRGHDDQVHLLGRRRLQNFLIGYAQLHETSHGHVSDFGLWEQECQLPAGVPLQRSSSGRATSIAYAGTSMTWSSDSFAPKVCARSNAEGTACFEGAEKSAACGW